MSNDKKTITNTNPMEVEIKEEDFYQYLDSSTSDKKSREEADVAAGKLDTIKNWFSRSDKTDKEDIQQTPEMEELRSLLPKVVANKIAKRVPEGFALSEIKFSGEVSGQPFGIGIAGNVEVTFTKLK